MNFKIVFILICLFFSITAKAQNNHLQIDYANNLYNSGQFFDAITEYKRLLFFDSSSTIKYQVNYKIADSYKAGGKFDEAIKYFSIACVNTADDEELFDAKVQIIRSNILRKTTDRALLLCDEIDKDSRFKYKTDKINYWRGWAYMFADDWKNAARMFDKISYNHELKKLAEQTDRAKVSVTFAKVISYILSGAGSIYAGKVLSGFMSLGWNALAGYWTINAFNAGRVFDGIVVGELVWLRFYRGSIQNAGEFAVEKNLEVADKTLRFLQNEYTGIKP
jgi:tetratricopeptide (TPR) repeat protein